VLDQGSRDHESAPKARRHATNEVLTARVGLVTVLIVNLDDGFGAAPVASAIAHGS
jgi:NCAIR mutase (PurE)-related protein